MVEEPLFTTDEDKKRLARHVVAVLNRALEKDRRAIEALVKMRVRCNEELANDETIQVGRDEENNFTVSPLGLLEGIVGVNRCQYGLFAAIFEVGCPVHGPMEKVSLGLPCRVEGCPHVMDIGQLKEFVVM